MENVTRFHLEDNNRRLAKAVLLLFLGGVCGMSVCLCFQEPPSPGAASVRSIPSTPSEFTFNSRSPAESLR